MKKNLNVFLSILFITIPIVSTSCSHDIELEEASETLESFSTDTNNLYAEKSRTMLPTVTASIGEGKGYRYNSKTNTKHGQSSSNESSKGKKENKYHFGRSDKSKHNR